MQTQFGMNIVMLNNVSMSKLKQCCQKVSGMLNPADIGTFGCLGFPLLSVLMHFIIPGSLETLDVNAK